MRKKLKDGNVLTVGERIIFTKMFKDFESLLEKAKYIVKGYETFQFLNSKGTVLFYLTVDYDSNYLFAKMKRFKKYTFKVLGL